MITKRCWPCSFVQHKIVKLSSNFHLHILKSIWNNHRLLPNECPQIICFLSFTNMIDNSDSRTILVCNVVWTPTWSIKKENCPSLTDNRQIILFGSTDFRKHENLSSTFFVYIIRIDNKHLLNHIANLSINKFID